MERYQPIRPYNPRRFYYGYGLSEEEIIYWLASPLSKPSIAVMMVLNDAIDQKNWDGGGRGSDWSNIISDLSVEALAARASITATQALEAIKQLNEFGFMTTSWLSGIEEEEIPGVCHSHKLAEPSDQEVLVNNTLVMREQIRHKEELRIRKEIKKEKQARKLAQQLESKS